ncbi:hypothetical protein RIR_jg35966.t1 [Rhizophagus irregularis DAOM 181602=DAOM 197198]|nr:hypothetical protein RIR_jg35966.t1 [Rhizophagus irregularis DAOM 181602=DAOM 197198]
MYHQADILYMPYDTVDRKLYKYCLNIVDVASRYKASVPLEDRSSARVAKAFKKIYGKADCPLIWPRVLQVDGGSEFKDEVIRLMDEKAKRLFKIQDAKELLTEDVNTAWVKNLSDIVNELNNSNTRLLGMSPVEAIQKDQVYALPSKIRKDRPVGAEEIRLPAGSLVRYLLDNSDYQGRRRATDPIWSTKVYTIESSTVVNGQPLYIGYLMDLKKYLLEKNY